MKRIFIPIIGVAAALALVTPAEAAESATPTSTLPRGAGATPTTVVEVVHTDVDDDDDDSDKTGLWGLLGLLGLAGLAGLAKKKQDPNYTGTRPVTGTAPPRADGATGTAR